MHILITAFEPFQQETINATMEALALLPDSAHGHTLTRRILPVEFGKAITAIEMLVEELCPDAVICLGQATGRSDVTPERVAINVSDARIPDNGGFQPADLPIREDGPAAYFSTVPVMKMAQAIRDREIPATVSNSAGAYVCNDTLYTLLHAYAGTATRVGFIHVPNTPDIGSPSLPLETIVAALVAAIENLD
jgi:pyroglutamyl-peptidase